MRKKKTREMRTLVLAAGLLISISIFLFSLNSNNNAFAALSVISPSNMQSWAFDVQSPDGFGTFVNGPATPPLGTGSVRLFTGTNGNLSIAFHSISFENLKLNEITRLAYSTYSVSDGPTTSKYPLLIISLSTPNGPDELIFDPAVGQSQIAKLNTWQNWDALSGNWRSALTNGNYVTLNAYIQAFSQNPGDIVLKNTGVGAIRMQAGPTATVDVLDQNIDNFIVGVSGGDIIFDFEPDNLPSPTPGVSPVPTPTPPSTPTDKDQCKNGGWNLFRNPAFKNQGDCVSFVNRINDNRDDKNRSGNNRGEENRSDNNSDKKNHSDNEK